MIRVSGDPGVLARPEVAKAVANAERYVQQYQYQQDVVTNVGQPQAAPDSWSRNSIAMPSINCCKALDSGLVQAAPASAHAAVVDTTPGSYRVWVSGVRSAQDYARLIGGLGRQ